MKLFSGPDTSPYEKLKDTLPIVTKRFQTYDKSIGLCWTMEDHSIGDFLYRHGDIFLIMDKNVKHAGTLWNQVAKVGMNWFPLEVCEFSVLAELFWNRCKSDKSFHANLKEKGIRAPNTKKESIHFISFDEKINRNFKSQDCSLWMEQITSVFEEKGQIGWIPVKFCLDIPNTLVDTLLEKCLQRDDKEERKLRNFKLKQ